MKQSKKLLSVFLALAMLFSLMTTALAVTPESVTVPTAEKTATLFVKDEMATKNSDGTYSVDVQITAAMNPSLYKKWTNAAFMVGVPNTEWATDQITAASGNFDDAGASVSNQLFDENGNMGIAAGDPDYEYAYRVFASSSLNKTLDSNGFAVLTLSLQNFTKADVNAEGESSFNVNVLISPKPSFGALDMNNKPSGNFPNITYLSGIISFPSDTVEVTFVDPDGNTVETATVDEGSTIPKEKFTDAEAALPDTDPVQEVLGWVDQDDPTGGYITPSTPIQEDMTVEPVTKDEVTKPGDPEIPGEKSVNNETIGANNFTRKVSDGTINSAQAITLAGAAAFDKDGNPLTVSVYPDGKLQTINQAITNNKPQVLPLTFQTAAGSLVTVDVTITTEYTVAFTDVDKTTPIGTDVVVPNGETVPEEDFPVDEVTNPDNKPLVGWVDQDGKLFDPDTPVDGDKTVSPILKDNETKPEDPGSEDNESIFADNMKHDIGDGPMDADEIFTKGAPVAFDAEGESIPLDQTSVVTDDGKLDAINAAISAGTITNPARTDGLWPITFTTPSGSTVDAYVELTSSNLVIPDPDPENPGDGVIMDGMYTMKILRTGDTSAFENVDTALDYNESIYEKTLPALTFGADGKPLSVEQINKLKVSKIALYSDNGDGTYSWVDTAQADSGVVVKIADGKITVRGTNSLIAKVTLSNASSSVDFVVIIPGNINLDDATDTNDAFLINELNAFNLDMTDYIYEIYMADMDCDSLADVSDLTVDTNDSFIINEMNAFNITPAN